MKIIFLIFAAICGSSLANIIPRINFDLKEQIAPRGINDEILKAIESLKKQMPYGFPELGIPVLAPFEKSYTEMDYSNKLFEMVASLIDLNVDGLNNFNVNEIKFSALTLKASFKFNFNELHARSQYVANAFIVTLFKVSGDGDFDIILRNLQFTGFAQLGVNSEGLLYMKDFNIVITLGELKSNITGLIWGRLTGRLANKALEIFVPMIIRREQKMISEFVKTMVTTNVNEILKGMTIQDLLDLINKPGNPDPVEYVPEKRFL